MAIKKLPAMEHTFTVEIKGSVTGQIFSGTFTYLKPTIRMKSDIAKTRALLDGGLPLDKDTAFLHEVLAELRHTLIDAPPWWIDKDYGFELRDFNVILDIFKECDEFEKTWFNAVWANEVSESEESEPQEPTQKKEPRQK